MILSTLKTIWSAFDSLITPLAKPAFIIGLLYALINWKTLPFAWHIRILNGYLLHYHLKSTSPLPPHPSTPISSMSPPTIFRPTTYTTSVPPSETDYSLHKSNSTYLTDVDIARGYHIYTVCYDGFKRWSAQGRGVTPMLGGTTCVFKREIKPFKKVRIWTRVLSWDGKWVYLVSHFVEGGWETGMGDKGGLEKQREGKAVAEDVSPLVYATCISKIVLKEGRRTVRPEEFFRLSGLIGDGSVDGGSEWREVNRVVEERRLEGMELAGHVAALDEGHRWFVEGGGGDVLGRY